MTGLEGQFLNVAKKVRQEAIGKMMRKMERAAENTMKAAPRLHGEYHDVTGNLYKSIAAGVYYKGTLQTVHKTPGADPKIPSLSKGIRYPYDTYYDGSPVEGRPYRGEYGKGGQWGPDAGEDLLYDFTPKGAGAMAWQMRLVAGVDYANYVQTKKGLDVMTRLREYMIRYYHKM